MTPELRDLIERQAGVVSRRQARDAGLRDHDLRRLVRRREWAPVHPGVYVDHTGPLTWLQRAWAAVLAVWPAALCHESALRAENGPRRLAAESRTAAIHVAIDRHRCVNAREGVVLHRIVRFDESVRHNASPPRIRIEEAVLAVAASARDDFAAIATLADAVQSRRTTPERMLRALEGRRRLRRRSFLQAALSDIADGTNSALEHAYLIRVERAHALPRPLRQHRPRGGNVFRDLDYAEFGLVVELDGGGFHDDAVARDADLERDLIAKVADGRDTVRLGWGQVVRRPCATAYSVATLLRARGWTGELTRCPSR